MLDLVIPLAAVACLVLAIPGITRIVALRRLEARMRAFCLAPTASKVQEIENLLSTHKVHRDELPTGLYQRWLNMRLAIDRLSVFRSGKEGAV